MHFQIEIRKYFISFLHRLRLILLPKQKLLQLLPVQSTISINIHVQKHPFSPYTTFTCDILVTQIPINKPAQIINISKVTQPLYQFLALQFLLHYLGFHLYITQLLHLIEPRCIAHLLHAHPVLGVGV